MTRFGRFDDEAREYVITRPDTPLPWINYLGSEGFFAIISNTAGGYSFDRDARLRRLTRYRYDASPADTGARFLYLRDAATGAFWSPSWQPVRTELEDYRCRHGLGYTVIGSRTSGIETESLYLVPLGESLEIWRTRITNRRADTARLSLFGAVEFCLWDAWDDQTNYQRNLSTGEVQVLDGVIYHTTEYRERRNHFAYFACSEEVSGFDTQREEFLGRYRGWDRPAVVESGRSRNSIAHGWAPIASHQLELELAPNETRDIVFLLGYAENPPDAKFDPPGSATLHTGAVLPVIERYLRGDEVDAALGRVHDRWAEHLDVLRVSTPNEHVDRMVNIWNPYQCMATFNLSRSASIVRHRDRTRDRVPGLEPGPSRLRAHGAQAGAGTAPRSRRDATSDGRRLPPVPAAHEAWERRDRLGVQRRSPLARPRRGRVREGDRRPAGPGRAGAVRQRARIGDAPARASAAGRSATPRTDSVRTGSP